MLMAQSKLQYDAYNENQYYDEPQVSQPRARKKAPVKKTAPAAKYKVQGLVVMLLMITVFGLIGAKTVHTTVVKAAEIRAIEKELQTLKVEKDFLQVEVDKLRSVGRIEKAALAMGMEKPEGTIYIASNLIQKETAQQEKAPGVEQTQKTAAVPDEGQSDSVFSRMAKVFTSFFASTQR